MSKIDSIFAGLVKSRRDICGFSQAELAEKVGLSRGSITNIEAGRQSVSLEQAMFISKVLCFSLTEIEVKTKELSLETKLKEVPKELRDTINKLLG